MPESLLPTPAPDEPLLDYVRRSVDYGLGSPFGADIGLLGVYRDLSEIERKIFVTELIHRYVSSLSSEELFKVRRRLS